MGKYIIKQLNSIKTKLLLKLKKVNMDISDFSDFEKILELENEIKEIEEYLYYNK